MSDRSTPADGPRLRILIAADTFAPDINGSASFSKRIAVALTVLGHDVHIAAPSPNRWHGTRTEVHDGSELTVHRLKSWPWPPHPWFRFALPWRIRREARAIVDAVQPDVVHFQSHIMVGRGFAPAAVDRGIRLIGTNHTMPENVAQHVTILPRFAVDRLVAWQWRSARQLFGMADAVTSPTQRSADYFDRMTGLTGTIAISNGIDPAFYHPSFERIPENRIVFVGRLDEEKHIDELIDAVAQLAPSLDATLDIIGMGEMRHRLEQQVARLGLRERVRFLGTVTDEELRATLSASTVFAMPSRAELQCIAAMEAMATALPVVAADAMALPHLVTDGENGYLYEPGDIAALADRLTRVLTAPDAELERMKRASLAKVGQHAMGRTVDQFLRLYRGLPIEEENVSSQ